MISQDTPLNCSLPPPPAVNEQPKETETHNSTFKVNTARVNLYRAQIIIYQIMICAR